MTIFGTLAFSVPAFAATTASLTPVQVKVTTGQQFNIVVMVSPQGTKDYAEKIEIDYPADTLQVTSFTLGNGAMALSQSGYDSTDNVNGVLVKTAGYSGGISSPTMFGTILFTAKKSGSGTIAIGSQSSSFQSSGQTAITGTGASFAVSAVTVAPSTAPTTNLAPVSSVNGQVIAAATTTATSTSTTTADNTVSNSQLAAVSASVPTGSGSVWIWVAIIALLAVVGGWIYGRKSSKK